MVKYNFSGSFEHPAPTCNGSAMTDGKTFFGKMIVKNRYGEKHKSPNPFVFEIARFQTLIDRNLSLAELVWHHFAT